MINLNIEICRKIREFRRAAGISQSALAAEVGCKQSAISMFEKGDGTKLNDETVEKLCKKFKIELPKKGLPQSAEIQSSAFAVRSINLRSGFCPNPDCPSHTKYSVDGKTLAMPDLGRQDPVGGKFCAVCGEVLEHRCPNCGAAVHAGAVCSFCGQPYVAVE